MVEVPDKVNYFENKCNYFIGYSEDHRDDISPVYMDIPQTTACVKSYDSETKWIYSFH